MSADSIRTTFPQLSEDDANSLLKLAAPRSYKAGESMIEKGSKDRSLIVIRKGIARVEQSRQAAGIALARLGPGQVLGEISFVDSGGASADVRAEEDVEASVIAEEDLRTLLTSDPGFANRFYRSLAFVLAARLRDVSTRLAALSVYEAAQSTPFHAPQTGQVTGRQLPDALMSSLHDFNAFVAELSQRADLGSGSDQAAASRMMESCDGLVRLLEEFTDDDTLLEISYDDLLAFRDTEQVGLGIGGTIFRETYPAFMASATIARCYMKPRGFPDDHETIDAIYRNEAEGDGVVGALIDRWFLSRPLCRSRRSIRDMMARHITKAAAGGSESAPTKITALASGTASEIFASLEETPRANILATNIDRDDEALLAAAARAERSGHGEQVRLVHADVLRLARDSDRYAFEPQDVIYALGLCDYLADRQIVELLDWAHGQLASGGLIAISNLHISNPDKAFMEHMIELRLAHRGEEHLSKLFAQSRFGSVEPRLAFDETGACMLAACVKP